jgi:hypothetical protein
MTHSFHGIDIKDVLMGLVRASDVRNKIYLRYVGKFLDKGFM